MDEWLLRTFQVEVRQQCRFVLLGAEKLAEAHRRLGAAFRGISTEEWMAGIRIDVRERLAAVDALWAAIQDILIAAGNLSKLFWGSGGGKAVERKPLRDSLHVADSSPLRDVDTRNDFEHFDERIQSHVEAGGPSVGFASRNIGGIEHAGSDPERHFGFYNPGTGVVTFWGHSMSLPAVVAEAKRILPIAEREVLGIDLNALLRELDP